MVIKDEARLQRAAEEFANKFKAVSKAALSCVGQPLALSYVGDSYGSLVFRISEMIGNCSREEFVIPFLYNGQEELAREARRQT